ncbi:MAG: CHASE domain-containing protein, partial [Phycisphaeraceae bacterium]|nr:CHASE domain-containing protein [Phycisphaeraceae bacterium]
MTRGLCTFSILTAISMIGLTGIAVMLIKSNNKIADQKHFNLLKSKLESEINQRVSVYKYGLMGTRSAFLASQNVEREEFRRLIEARQLEEEFPAVTGIGYIEHVPLNQLDTFLEQTRADGMPDYKISRLKETMDEPDYMLIKYIEPVLSNRQAMGLDIGSESIRREAATLAMQTGHATLTDRITLVQASREGAGFLLLLPLYNTARTPRNLQHRVQSIKGWVYMTILAERVFSGVTKNIDSELDFAVYDNKSMKPENLLFDQDYLSETSHKISAQNSRYHAVVDIPFGGKKLTASIRTTAHFKAATNTSAWLTGWGGCVVTILLTMLIQSQATAVSRANQIATNMTTDLRTNVIHLYEAMQSAEEARNSAEHANATKSDFLATMSHEIRTPLNGILGMTSVLSQSQLTTEQRANVRTVIHSSEALLAIINDILDISKIEAGKLELEKIDFAPQSVAKEIMELLQFMAKDKGLQLNLEIEDNVPSWV